jgi:hypothetical protein
MQTGANANVKQKKCCLVYDDELVTKSKELGFNLSKTFEKSFKNN